MTQVNKLTGRVTLFLLKSQMFEEEKILSDLVRSIESDGCVFEVRRGRDILVSFAIFKIKGEDENDRS